MDTVRRREATRSESGFTLIELMITLTVVAIGVLTIAAAQLSAMREGKQGHHRSQAAGIARDQLANVEPRLVLTDDPLLRDASVDRILIVNTWHHIPERQRYSALLARALKAGGIIYVVDFTMEADHGPAKHHRLQPDAVEAELKSAGLDTSTDKVLLPYQYIVSGTKRSAPEESPE